MQWGGALMGAAKNGQTLAELNPEKIKLLDMPSAKMLAASGVATTQSGVGAASAPISTPVISAPIVTVPISPASAPAAISPLLPAPASVVAPATLPAAAPPVQVLTNAIKDKSGIKTCMEWGEFSGTDLALASKELEVLKLGDRQSQRTIEYASGYWVYIPPLHTQAALNKKIEQIKALGLQDFYVVKEPKKWIRAISLGVFKTQEAAQNYQMILKKKGLTTAKVGERKRKLKFIVFALKNIDAEERSKLIKLQKDIVNSELKAVACK